MCNTPDVLSLATAETALLLMLVAARRAGEGERMVRAGRWDGWSPTQLRVRRGRTSAGRLRHGADRRELARLARGMGMIIHYRDIVRLPTALEAGAIYHDDDATFLARVMC